jgi:3-deoxy-D-manno-octulosonic-acid transferase
VKRVLALWLYDLLMYALTPLLWLRLHWRARAEPLYGERISERFARYHSTSSGGRVWLHAVSLGETRAAEPLIAALRLQRPGLRLLLTHGTATGRAAGAALLQGGDRQCWLPLDTSGGAARFFHHHRPVLGVLMETEVWPNLMRQAERFDVPVALVNARLSPRSLVAAQRFPALLRPAAQRLSLVLAQTAADAHRLAEAGAPMPQVSGNLKFDVAPDLVPLSVGAAWSMALQAVQGRPVVLAAAWREGEDALLLDAWRAALAWPLPGDIEAHDVQARDSRAGDAGRGERAAEGPTRVEPAWRDAAVASNARPLLVLVPRHPQRFDEVAQAVQAAGFTLARRSAWGDGLPDAAACAADVWLGDSMREMAAYYLLADIVLLGGSWAPLGGQNLIEPAACGRIVVMGPHTFNFADAAALAERAGAARRAENLRAGVAEALRLLVPTQADERLTRQAAAAAFAAAHRGAAGRMAAQLLALLERAKS